LNQFSKHDIKSEIPMSPIKAVLFDLDDTLWPIMPVIKRAEAVLHEWLAIHAPDVTRHYTIEQLRDMRQRLLNTDTRYQIDLWSLRHATLTEAFLAVKEDTNKISLAMEIFSKARNEVMPFDDVLPTLTKLNGMVKVGSVSNGFADLEIIGLARHFHVSIAAHAFGCAKPDPAIFHAACEALRVLPEETVYIGDDPALDVEGAQKAGLSGVWMNRTGIEPVKILPNHIQPDAIFATLYELDHWLAGRLGETPG
jgi:HAD superfamily hydrolase (TIGR01549 family)